MWKQKKILSKKFGESDSRMQSVYQMTAFRIWREKTKLNIYYYIVNRLCGVHFVGNPYIVEKFHLKLCIVNKKNRNLKVNGEENGRRGRNSERAHLTKWTRENQSK